MTCRHLFNVEARQDSHFRLIFVCKDCRVIHSWLTYEAATRGALAAWQQMCAERYHQLIQAATPKEPTPAQLLPDGERITDDNGDELEHGTESDQEHNPWDASCSRNGMGEPTRGGAVCHRCHPRYDEPAAGRAEPPEEQK